MISPLDIALDAIGTPFHHQGRLVGVGLDCAGLIIYVARTLGYRPYDEVYGHWPVPGKIEGWLRNQPDIFREVAVDSPGVILTFRLKRSGTIWHLGFSTGDGGVVHACRVSGRVVGAYRKDWMKYLGPRFEFVR